MLCPFVLFFLVFTLPILFFQLPCTIFKCLFGKYLIYSIFLFLKYIWIIDLILLNVNDEWMVIIVNFSMFSHFICIFVYTIWKDIENIIILQKHIHIIIYSKNGICVACIHIVCIFSMNFLLTHFICI